MHRLPKETFEVMTGDGVTYQLYDLVTHPGYVLPFRTNNIALIGVSIPLNLVVRSATIKFLPDNIAVQELSRWNPSQQSTVTTIPMAACQASYTGLSPGYVTEKDLCVAKEGDETDVQDVSAAY